MKLIKRISQTGRADDPVTAALKEVYGETHLNADQVDDLVKYAKEMVQSGESPDYEDAVHAVLSDVSGFEFTEDPEYKEMVDRLLSKMNDGEEEEEDYDDEDQEIQDRHSNHLGLTDDETDDEDDDSDEDQVIQDRHADHDDDMGEEEDEGDFYSRSENPPPQKLNDLYH